MKRGKSIFAINAILMQNYKQLLLGGILCLVIAILGFMGKQIFILLY